MENLSISPASLLSLLTPLFTLLISIYYAAKKTDPEAFFLVVGSLVIFSTSILFSFLPYYIQSRSMPIERVSSCYTIIGAIGFMGSVIFTIGFLMLVLKLIKINEQLKNKKSIL